MIVADLIRDAYANLGAVDIEDGPTVAQYDQGLRALNSLLATWSTELALYGLVDEVFTLIPGQDVYTVGVGGDFNTAWAYSIESAFIRDVNNIDYQLQIISEGQYDNISDKTTESRPDYLLYVPRGFPTGTATIFYVPDAAYELHWTAQKVIKEFATIEDTVGIAPVYQEALEYNLSLRLAPKCGVPVPQEVALLATTSKAAIPIPLEPASFDGAFGAGKRYSVYSDNI